MHRPNAARHARPLLLATALTATALFASGPQAAVRYTGSFTGIASAEQLPLNFPPPLPASYYDGATVTGTFDINVVAPS